eukprot:m.114777 g.114777  ORF g.114777 m.114777 type:complete len:202 (+) comp14177_c3_seq2:280-885(+)
MFCKPKKNAERELEPGQEKSVTASLSKKVAAALSTGSATMRSFGYSGQVKVTGSVFGVSLSMGVRVEVERTEGEIAAGSDDDEPEIPDLDEDASNPDDEMNSPKKKSAFNKKLKGAAQGALKRVKTVAFTMQKFGIVGIVGVGLDIKVFGTGIQVEFEVELSSALTEAEFQELEEKSKAQEEAKKAKKAAKAAKKEKKTEK